MRIPFKIPFEFQDDYMLCRAWDEERLKQKGTVNSDVNVVWLYKQAKELEKKII